MTTEIKKQQEIEIPQGRMILFENSVQYIDLGGKMIKEVILPVVPALIGLTHVSDDVISRVTQEPGVTVKVAMPQIKKSQYRPQSQPTKEKSDNFLGLGAYYDESTAEFNLPNTPDIIQAAVERYHYTVTEDLGLLVSGLLGVGTAEIEHQQEAA